MIGDGEHISNTLNSGSMDDVGTRISHLLDLYNLWMAGADICDRYDRHQPLYYEKRTELEHALKLLRFHMEKDYTGHSYRTEIDSLPNSGEDNKEKS